REPPLATAIRRLALRRVPRLRARTRSRSASRSRAHRELDAARGPRDDRALPRQLRPRRRRRGAPSRGDLRDLPATRGDRLVPLERAARARALLPRTPGGVDQEALAAR